MLLGSFVNTIQKFGNPHKLLCLPLTRRKHTLCFSVTLKYIHGHEPTFYAVPHKVGVKPFIDFTEKRLQGFPE